MQILLFIAMLAVVVVLVAGVILMMRGGDLNRKYGNKLMIARVSLQFLAIVLVGLVVMAGKH